MSALSHKEVKYTALCCTHLRAPEPPCAFSCMLLNRCMDSGLGEVRKKRVGKGKCIMICKPARWRGEKRVRKSEKGCARGKKERESDRERVRLTRLLVKQCRLPHQRQMLVLPGAGYLVQRGEKKGKVKNKRQGRWRILYIYIYMMALTAPLHCTELK